MPQIQTTTVTIQYTGVAISPDNFQINIIDYSGASRIYNNTDVTKVSRGTLLSGYIVSGISAGDVTIRATASGACTTSADVDVTTIGMTNYIPPAVSEIYPGNPGSTASFDPNASATYQIGQFTGYTFMETSDLSISHVSTTGNSESGGPFSSFSITEPTSGVFYIFGVNKLMANDGSTNTSIFRLTYEPNGNYSDFNVKWLVGA